MTEEALEQQHILPHPEISDCLDRLVAFLHGGCSLLAFCYFRLEDPGEVKLMSECVVMPKSCDDDDDDNCGGDDDDDDASSDSREEV